MVDPAPTPDSPLAQPDAAPLFPSRGLLELGALLVVAPHPDDESLGCGGAIAAARHYGVPVQVLFVTDGSRSHPNSKAYPAPRLRAVREGEALAALRELGVPASAATFLRYGDCAVPAPDGGAFTAAVTRCARYFARSRAGTILLPWRRDPHRDHRATWVLAQRAFAKAGLKPRQLEYAIWVWDFGAEPDFPRYGETPVWRLDIAPFVERKRHAIAAHRSQTTALIDDDPAGFRLSAAQLARFHQPWELFIGPVPTTRSASHNGS